MDLVCSPAGLTAGIALPHLQSGHNLRSHHLAALQALSQLQDRLEPFPTPTAMALIEEELGAKIGQVFSELSARPVAAASLGQVRRLPRQQHSMLASFFLQLGRTYTHATVNGSVCVLTEAHVDLRWPWMKLCAARSVYKVSQCCA